VNLENFTFKNNLEFFLEPCVTVYFSQPDLSSSLVKTPQ